LSVKKLQLRVALGWATEGLVDQVRGRDSGAVRSGAVRDRLQKRDEMRRGPLFVSSSRMYGEGHIFSQKRR